VLYWSCGGPGNWFGEDRKTVRRSASTDRRTYSFFPKYSKILTPIEISWLLNAPVGIFDEELNAKAIYNTF
jgi:hypothetical protein